MLIKVEVEVPKAIKDYCDLVVLLTADLVAKKPAAEITTNILPKLMVAAGQFNDLSTDIKDEKAFDAIGLMVSGLVKIFVPDQPAQVPPVA